MNSLDCPALCSNESVFSIQKFIHQLFIVRQIAYGHSSLASAHAWMQKLTQSPSQMESINISLFAAPILHQYISVSVIMYTRGFFGLGERGKFQQVFLLILFPAFAPSTLLTVCLHTALGTFCLRRERVLPSFRSPGLSDSTPFEDRCWFAIIKTRDVLGLAPSDYRVDWRALVQHNHVRVKEHLSEPETLYNVGNPASNSFQPSQPSIIDAATSHILP